MSTKYSVIKHIRYEINSDAGNKVLIIPNSTGVPDMKNVLCLSEVSLEIWDMICNNFTTPEIVGALCEKYQKNKGEIPKDVEEFLKSLFDKKYIEVLESDSK